MKRNPRVVIVGAGFGGLKAAQVLSRAHLELTLIDRNNHHLFQPLLYQVAAAYLDPEQIAKPVRGIFRGRGNVSFRMTEMTGVDLTNRVVHTSSGGVDYDYLILAVGGQTNFFGMEGVQKHGFALKRLSDGVGIRNHLLESFERAALEPDAERRRSLLSAVVGGGGAAGVEMAGALAELTGSVLSRDFKEFGSDDIRIILCEGADRLLPDLPADLAREAQRILKAKGVEVRLSSFITDYDGEEVRLKTGPPIPAGTLIWTAGIQAAAITRKLGLPLDAGGRITVEPTLQVPGHPEVFAIGDGAYWEEEGKPIPMVAPAAVQMAEVAAANILRRTRGEALRPFHYRNPGALATIGRNAAVARVKGVKFRGFSAWLVWLVVHLIRLVGFRNRLVVLINWAWDYFFFERASRIIIHNQEEP
jgi:NADH dehydrogenase